MKEAAKEFISRQGIIVKDWECFFKATGDIITHWMADFAQQQTEELQKELEQVKEERDALRAFREKDKLLSMGSRFDAANKRFEENQQLKERVKELEEGVTEIKKCLDRNTPMDTDSRVCVSIERITEQLLNKG